MSEIRILVVDDNQDNLAMYRDILVPDLPVVSERLSALESTLFASVEPASSMPQFVLDLESDGETACQRLQYAGRCGWSYDLAFVDMRMPGGWSGIETITQLWRQDPHLHVVICTAYSDYSWSEITQILGRPEQLKMLNKPFERQQVLALALDLGK
jgi:CheY-like chemotaxis protein